jgi:hypothetical protein
VDLTDLELASKVVANDELALWEIVERHYAPIYRFVRRLAGADETARELTQETRETSRSLSKRSMREAVRKRWSRDDQLAR